MRHSLLALVLFLIAGTAEAETLEERQARSIAILRAGILSRPMVTISPAPAHYARSYRSWSSQVEIVTDDIFLDPVRVETRYPVLDHDDQGQGYYHPPLRIRVPPVTHHISRASKVVYEVENSPHDDRSTSRFARSWRE